LASSANALIVDLRADHVDTLEVTLTPLDDTVRISVYSDTGIAGNYSRVVTVDDFGRTSEDDGRTSELGIFTDMTKTANAGPDAYTCRGVEGYALWAYLVEARDFDPGNPPPIVAGEHFWFDYTASSFNSDGSIQQIVDLRRTDLTWTLIETMTITQVPEPATIVLLGLGSLLLLRRRK